MLTAAPKRWLSWDYEVSDANGLHVGDARLSRWTATGAITVGDQMYRVWREGVFFGPILLFGSAGETARATRRRSLVRAVSIEYGGRVFLLKSPSLGFREMRLYEGEAEIGSAVPEGVFSRRAQFDLPESLPGELRLFVVWLALYQWKKWQDSRVSFTGTYEVAPPRA
jgi:hypothetical protein